uniref:AIG1-type G domain-containing protein n=1 Tax=Oncorhynchus kisutch TaxID=8019 RepID=A0A8C7J197_ONCKI
MYNRMCSRTACLSHCTESGTVYNLFKTVGKIETYFSPEAFKYATVLFTHGDQQNDELNKLVEKCGGCYHVIDNKYWNTNQQGRYRNNQYQVAELLNTIEKMVRDNGGAFYTNEMLQEAERLIQAEMESLRKESIGQMSEKEMGKQAKEIVRNKLLIKLSGTLTGLLHGSHCLSTHINQSDLGKDVLFPPKVPHCRDYGLRTHLQRNAQYPRADAGHGQGLEFHGLCQIQDCLYCLLQQRTLIPPYAAPYWSHCMQQHLTRQIPPCSLYHCTCGHSPYLPNQIPAGPLYRRPPRPAQSCSHALSMIHVLIGCVHQRIHLFLGDVTLTNNYLQSQTEAIAGGCDHLLLYRSGSCFTDYAILILLMVSHDSYTGPAHQKGPNLLPQLLNLLHVAQQLHSTPRTIPGYHPASALVHLLHLRLKLRFQFSQEGTVGHVNLLLPKLPQQILLSLVQFPRGEGEQTEFCIPQLYLHMESQPQQTAQVPRPPILLPQEGQEVEGHLRHHPLQHQRDFICN